MDRDETVRSYKLLSQVERAWRSFKTIDLKVRPTRHHDENRVRAHIFLCMPAYYVQWHMIEAWRPLLFCDEDQDAKTKRDPVAPAQRSEAALDKVHTRKTDDGSEVHSFKTLMFLLSSLLSKAGPAKIPHPGKQETRELKRRYSGLRFSARQHEAVQDAAKAMLVANPLHPPFAKGERGGLDTIAVHHRSSYPGRLEGTVPCKTCFGQMCFILYRAQHLPHAKC